MTWYPTSDYDWTTRDINNNDVGHVRMEKIPFDHEGLDNTCTTLQDIGVTEFPSFGSVRNVVEVIYSKGIKNGIVVARAVGTACQISETLKDIDDLVIPEEWREKLARMVIEERLDKAM